MKTLFLTAATAALIFAAPTAFAADDHHGHPGGGDQHTAHTAPVHTGSVHTGTVHTTTPAMTMSDHHNDRSHHGMTTTTAAPTGFGNSGNSGHHGDRHDHGAMGGVNINAGGVHAHINFNRHNVTASHHFHYHGGAYRGPSGYSYHRYSYGDTLPSIYFARDYWISDYSDYGLSYPPDGCVWVRYGDDAILIDEDSGDILEVVYGQFY